MMNGIVAQNAGENTQPKRGKSQIERKTKIMNEAKNNGQCISLMSANHFVC